MRSKWTTTLLAVVLTLCMPLVHPFAVDLSYMSVSVSSHSGFTQVGVPVRVDLSRCPRNGTGELHYTFEMGDGTIYATTDTSVIHTYNKAGSMHIRVSASDDADSLTLDGSSHPFVSLQVNVQPTQGAYHFMAWTPLENKTNDESFSMGQSILLAGGESSIIYVNVVDPRNPSRVRSQQLTRQLAGYGEFLKVIFHNASITADPISRKLDDETGAWKLVVTTKNVADSVVLSMIPVGVSVLGEHVATTSVVVAVLASSQSAISDHETEHSGVLLGNQILNNNVHPLFLKARQHACWRQYGLALLGFDSDISLSNGTIRSRGLALETFDMYGPNTHIIDLTRRLQFSNRSVIPTASEIKSIRVYDLIIRRNHIVLATSFGIFHSSPLLSDDDNADDNMMVFEWIETGHAAIDDGFILMEDTSDSMQYVSFHHSERCLAATQAAPVDAVMLQYEHPSLSTVLHWFSTNETWVPAQVPSEGATVSDTDSSMTTMTLTQDYTLQTMAYDGLHGYMVHVAIGQNDGNVAILLKDASGWMLGYEFSDSLHASCGHISSGEKIQLHVGESGLFLFSNQIWHSVDGGKRFMFVACMPAQKNIVHFLSTAVQGGYAVVGESGVVYYGKVSSSFLSPVLGMLYDGASFDFTNVEYRPALHRVETVMFNELGQLIMLSLVSPYDFSAADVTSDTATSFLVDASGELWSYDTHATHLIETTVLNTHMSDDIATSLHVPLLAGEKNDDTLAIALVPVFQSNTVRFYLVDTTKLLYSSIGTITAQQTYTMHHKWAQSELDLLNMYVVNEYEDLSVEISSLETALDGGAGSNDGWHVLRGRISQDEAFLNQVPFCDFALLNVDAVSGAVIAADETTQVHLTLVNSSKLWDASYVGQTVVSPLLSILITGVESDMVAHGLVLYSGLRQAPRYGNDTSNTTSLEPHNWRTADFRSFRGLFQGSTWDPLHFSVVSSDENEFTLTTSSGHVFTDADVSNVLWWAGLEEVEAHWGIINSVLNNSTVTFTKAGANYHTLPVDASWSVTGNSSNSSGAWHMLSPVKSDSFATFLPWTHPVSDLVKFSTRSWHVKMSNCSHEFFSDNSLEGGRKLNEVVYLDHDETFTLHSFVSPANTPLTVMISNPYSVETQISTSMEITPMEVLSQYYNKNADHVMSLSERRLATAESVTDFSMNFTNALGNVAFLDVLISPTHVSFACPSSRQVKRLVLGCPPSKRIVVDHGISLRDFLHDEDDSFVTLPWNYRPPSKYGRAIPTSDNVYNANPEKPKYNNEFDISRTSGVYKQCAWEDQSDVRCGCTDDQRFSELSEHSDCIDKVLSVPYTEPFAPRFVVLEEGKANKFLELPVRLTEVNGRTDYCFNSTNCGLTKEKREVPFYPNLQKPNGIIWLADELFHFRVEVLAGTECALVTEFKIYVSNPPLHRTHESVVLTCTVMVCGIALLIGYVFYVRHHGTLSNNPVPSIFVINPGKKYEKIE